MAIKKPVSGGVREKLAAQAISWQTNNYGLNSLFIFEISGASGPFSGAFSGRKNMLAWILHAIYNWALEQRREMSYTP